MAETPARAATHRGILVRYGVLRVKLTGLIVVLAVAAMGGVAACNRADTPADDAPSRVAVPEASDPPVGAPPTGAPAAVAAPDGVVPAPESPAPQSPALPLELSSPEHQRYQQLRLETLRLMIEAARRALPIGPFQQRIDAAARTALQDVSEAGDRMEEIAAELREAIAAADR